MSVYIPTVIHLFGPVDGAAALSQVALGDTYYWPGSCDTAHIAVFQTEFHPPPLKYAIWRMCVSQPAGNSIFRLVTCSDGPSNINPIGYINMISKPAGIGVWNAACDVTAGLSAWLQANPKTECNVGWQVAGDGTYPFTVYNVRLELVWEVG